MKIEDWSHEMLLDEFARASLVRGHGTLFISCDAAGEIDKYNRCRVELLRRLYGQAERETK